MHKTVALGFIGIGGAGSHHVTAAAQTAGARVAALCDLDAQKLARIAGSHRSAATFTDPAKLLAMEELDGVVVALPNALHAPMVTDALRAGKNVLCEKPPALNGDLAAKMEREAARAKKLLVYGFQRRFYPSSRHASRMLSRGEAGEVYFVKTGWLRRDVELPAWFLKKKLSGGGPLIDLGVHMLDVTLWLMGYPKAVAVLSTVERKFGTYDVEDFAAAMIRLGNGATLFLEASRKVHGNIPRGGDQAYWNVLGSRAGLSWPPLAVHRDRRGKPVDLAPALAADDWIAGIGAQMKEFVRRIRGGDTDLTQARQGTQLMRIVDAIYESARRKTAVKPAG
ncbi:MAG: Gfo/Idh/MocA family oxidoreductase [Planctomycetota bacterium]